MLAPRSTYVVDLKSYFVQLQDTSCDFHSVPRPGVPNHVFTDGSFFKGVVSNLDRAAWAVVNSTTGKSISYGGVPGLLQTIGRAELYGLISATTWAITHSAHVILWTDSAGTCRKAQAVLAGFFTDDVDGDNHDLWVRLADALSSASAGQVEFRWLPSHVDTSLCDSTLEEYLATWNDIVDHHAVQANRQRGAAFETLCKQAEEHYSLWEKRLHHLRHFYLQVAKAQQDQPDVIDLTFEPTDLIERVTQMPLGDVLTVDWQHQLRQQSDFLSMPVEFILFLFPMCIAKEPMHPSFEAISFVELALWSVQNLSMQFPTERAADGQWKFKLISEMLLRPTLAFLVQRIRQGFTCGLKALGLDRFICRHLSRQIAGIAVSVDGLLLSIPTEFAAQLCDISARFFGPKMLRKSADLAKPVY